jgi:phosphoribosyl 1,2-cyclic phosphate phosphodiesterase
MSLTFTILGCGSSMGVPRVALGWGECDPNNPKNRRRRCALLVERAPGQGKVTRVLVDCTPDLREQLLDAQVDWVDSVLITHEHADHTHGIDDLRPLYVHKRHRLPVYMDEPTSRAMHARFSYCFTKPLGSEYPPIAVEHRLVPGHAVTIEGQGGPIEVLPVLQEHMNLDEALAWVARIKPKRAILTNLHADLDYEALRASLPPNVEPAYDRMSFAAA